MTKAINNNDTTTKAILHNLSMVEALRNKRIGLYDLVKDQIDGIDKQKKETVILLKAQFKGLNDLTQCVDIANILCPTVSGSDDAGRKRISRRRSLCIKLVTEIYPDYDLNVTKGKSGGKIVASFIGDAHLRAAAVTVQEIADTFCILGLTMPDGLTITALAAALRGDVSAVPVSLNDSPIVLDGIDFAAIAEKAASIADAKKSLQAAK